MTERRTCTAAALAAAALLAACAPMIPTYERPAAPVAASYPMAATVAADPAAKPAVDNDWRQIFLGERLVRLIAAPLENNRDLRIAALNIEQARATAQIRRADLWPTVGVGASGNRQPSPAGGMSSTYTVGLAVSAWELDLFGRIRSLSEAALAQYLATEEARKGVQTSLIAAVANTYLALRADEQLLAVTERALKTREESLRLTKLKFDNGVSSELDFRQAESLLEAARVSLAQLTRQRAMDENALTLLIGQPLPADLPAGLALTDQRLLPDLPAGLPSDLLTRRADVRAAEQQLLAANANIGAARAAFFPRITLTGSVGVASTDLDRLLGHGRSAWTFMPQLLLPIFDAGRNQANLEVAQVTRDIAVAQYERAIQTAFREVADALAGRATLGEQLRAQAAQTNAEEVRFRLADLRYRNGAASYLDVLDAQRSLLAAQQALVQTQALQVQNLVTVYRVLGGGWSERESTAAR